jgi:hypothetical protein
MIAIAIAIAMLCYDIAMLWLLETPSPVQSIQDSSSLYT